MTEQPHISPIEHELLQKRYEMLLNGSYALLTAYNDYKQFPNSMNYRGKFLRARSTLERLIKEGRGIIQSKQTTIF